MTGKGEGAVPWEGENQLPSGRRRLPSNCTGREWWQGREGCSGSAPGSREAVCPYSFQPSPSAVIGGKSWAGTLPQTWSEVGAKKPDIKVQDHPGLPECMGGTSDPAPPPEHPLPDPSVCPSLPTACVTAAWGGTWKTVQHSGWGTLHLRKGKRVGDYASGHRVSTDLIT